MRLSDRPTLPLDQVVGSSGAEDSILARLCFKLSVGYTDDVLTQTIGSSGTTVFAALTLQLVRRY
jgi:hypothetical protein